MHSGRTMPFLAIVMGAYRRDGFVGREGRRTTIAW